jgi:hypothetical protein
VSSPEQPNQPELPEQSAGTPDAPGPVQHSADPVETVIDETTVTVRRSPRYFNFMLLGAVLGVLAAVILTVVFPTNPQFGRMQVFGFLLLACIAIGVAVGCLVAIVLDRIAGRTARTAVADRMGTHTSGTKPE